MMVTMLDKVLALALGEVGYLEKKSNAQLDDKTANAGDKNYNKYAAYLIKMIGSPYVQAQPWCDMFVDWLFVTIFGVKRAKQMIGGWSCYTPTSAQYYKKMGAWFSTPKVGDQIFFKNSQRICHTGIVYAIDSKYVYTVEGNTSSASGVVTNGGAVAKKKYLLSYSRIAGYGRPKYDEIAVSKSDNPYEKPIKSVKKGDKGEGVKWLQFELNKHGYSLDMDGDFGRLTHDALVDYQNKHKLEPDGICGKLTRNSLCGL